MILCKNIVPIWKIFKFKKQNTEWKYDEGIHRRDMKNKKLEKQTNLFIFINFNLYKKYNLSSFHQNKQMFENIYYIDGENYLRVFNYQIISTQERNILKVFHPIKTNLCILPLEYSLKTNDWLFDCWTHDNFILFSIPLKVKFI